MVSGEEPAYAFAASAEPLFQATPFREIAQVFTLEALQVIVEDCPLRTRCGAAEMLSEGTVTVTVAFAGEEVPPGPVHVIEYVDVVEGLTAALPEVAPPVLKPPAEVQEVAFVELQESVELWPLLIADGEAVSVAVGSGGITEQEFEFWLQLPLLQVKLQAPAYPAAHEPVLPPEAVAESTQLLIVVAGHDPLVTVIVTDATGEVPPGPEHWKVNVVLEVSGSVHPLPESEPEFDQGPPAVHEVAFVELQESVERLPEETEVGEALRETVGAAGVDGGGTYQQRLLVVPPLEPLQYHWYEPSDCALFAPSEPDEQPFTG